MAKTLSVSDFREQCLQLLDDLPNDGVVITKRGKPLAKVVPIIKSTADLFGLIPNFRVDPEDDLFSPNVEFTADEENVKPRHTRSR